MKIIGLQKFILINIVTIFIGIQSTEIDLRFYEKRLISQYGEDGIIEKIFKVIGATDKYYVDFGAGDGHFCSNTKYLREKHGWTGLLMDGGFSNKMDNNVFINLHKEFVTAENICNLFAKYKVPQEFDLITIDIDRNDFYVWQSLSKYYKPRVVIIEFNGGFSAKQDLVIKYLPSSEGEGCHYFGASILAFFNLGRKLGYSLVYDSEGVNLFFIRDDVIESCKTKFKNINNVEKLYKGVSTPANRTFDFNRLASEFITSQEAMQA